ncbi:MAG: hypothetical protein ACJ8F1_02775 [Polyangia bacterium]
MKSILLASTTALLLTAAACSNTPPTVTTGEGGSNGSGGANTGGTSPTGSGGANSGGSTGAGGTSTGGSTGTGGIESGSGGVGSGGSTGTGGGGGTTGVGGRATGTGGSNVGGSTGTGGSNVGGGGGTIDPATVVGGLDGALMLHACARASNDGYDCPNIGPCTNNAATWTKSFDISGTAGKTYNMTFHVYGVVEPYNYVGGTRAAGNNTSILTDMNLFLSGGAQQPANGNGYDYNTYEMDVFPAGTGMQPDVYFLNSVDNNENPHTSGNTQHLTFPISYSATVKVYGGGKVVFTTFDSNCTQVMNCGTKAQNAGNVCTMHYSVPLTGTTPAAPTTFMQPYTSGTGSQFGQWVYIDVTALAAAP